MSLLNYRHKKINFFVNYGIAYRKQPNTGSLYQEVYSGDTTFILKQIARSLRKYSRQNQEIMEGLTRTLKESLDGTRIVQSFGLLLMGYISEMAV